MFEEKMNSIRLSLPGCRLFEYPSSYIWELTSAVIDFFSFVSENHGTQGLDATAACALDFFSSRQLLTVFYMSNPVYGGVVYRHLQQLVWVVWVYFVYRLF